MELVIKRIFLYLVSEGDEFEDALNEEKECDGEVHDGQGVHKLWRRLVIL